MMNLAYIFKHKNVLKYIFVAQYLFILFIIWITLCVLNQLEKFVISDEGHSSSTQLTQNGAWCWFADPRAIYYKGLLHETTYVGYVNNRGDIMVSSIDHHYSNKQHLKEVLVRRGLDKDDHANPSLIILQNGHLIIFYSAHNGRKMYYRISTYPEDISSWNQEKGMPEEMKGRKGFTYPNPILLEKEGPNPRLVLFWRGGNWKPTFSYVTNLLEITQDPSQALTWEIPQEIISGHAARPYIKLEHEVTRGHEKIHMAFTDGHPRDVSHNAIYYTCWNKDHLQKANGEEIADFNQLPVSPQQTDVVYDGSNGRAWIWDIAFDYQKKVPVIVYARFPTETEHYYHYARWSHQQLQWVDTQLVFAGSWFPQTFGTIEKEPHYSAGITLDHSNPERLIMSRLIDGQFEIEIWTTEDGVLWIRKQITKNSQHLNVRPIFARTSSKSESKSLILWMRGNYQHYTKFSTSIEYLFLT